MPQQHIVPSAINTFTLFAKAKDLIDNAMGDLDGYHFEKPCRKCRTRFCFYTMTFYFNGSPFCQDRLLK